jgi:hypothetical protein
VLERIGDECFPPLDTLDVMATAACYLASGCMMLA